MNEIRNILIGYELGAKTSQLCYYDRKNQEPLSIPTKVGTSLYDFPTALCKIEGKNEWHFGLEAEYFGHQPGGIYISDLYERCQSETPAIIDKTSMEPWELLEVFLRESLRMLGIQDLRKAIGGIMMTCQSLDKIFVQNVRKAYEHMGFSKEKYYIQDFRESFYYYTMYQKPEIWSRKVALYTFAQEQVAFGELSADHKTRPAMVQLQNFQQTALGELPEQRDREFHDFIEQTIGSGTFSSVFITGEGFDKEWAKQSVPLLCSGHRHVFYGNNLFVKGACYGVKEKIEEKNLKNYLYLGQDLVRTNLGMEMLVSGVSAYYPLIVAGVNWYEAVQECELVLDGKDSLTFLVHHMEGGEKKAYSMPLPGMPERPNRATRLHLKAECDAPDKCLVTVEDMGFGELFPTSKKVWKETLTF